MGEVLRCPITSAPLKFGFVRIPSKLTSFFPKGDKTTFVKVYFDSSNEAKEARYQPPPRNRLRIPKIWYTMNSAKVGDVVIIEVSGPGEYRLRLEQGTGASSRTFLQRLEESDLYPHVKAALQKIIQGKDAYLEITSSAAKLPAKIERFLDNSAFFYLKTERNSPDVMGYVTEVESSLAFGINSREVRSWIVAEVKDEPVSITDFYQAKRYAEVFNAKYAFLISNAPVPEGLRRFLQERGSVVHYEYSSETRNIIYGQIDIRSDTLEFEEF